MSREDPEIHVRHKDDRHVSDSDTDNDSSDTDDGFGVELVDDDMLKNSVKKGAPDLVLHVQLTATQNSLIRANAKIQEARREIDRLEEKLRYITLDLSNLQLELEKKKKEVRLLRANEEYVDLIATRLYLVFSFLVMLAIARWFVVMGIL